MKSLARATVFAVPFLTAALVATPAFAADDPTQPPPAPPAPAAPTGPTVAAEPPARPAPVEKDEKAEHAGSDDHEGHGDHHGHGDHQGRGHHDGHGDHDGDDDGDHPHAHQRDSSDDKWADLHDWMHLDLGPLRIAPVVLMQVQAIPYVGGDSLLQTGDPAERGGFRMRRARFGFEGRVFRRVPFKITAEFNSDAKGTALLHDAYFGYDRFQPVQIYAGAQAVPFSRSAMIESGGGALIERPFAARAMAPFHQLGLSARGRFFSGALKYNLGVYNGLQRSDQFFGGYTENSAINGNRFDGLTYAARLGSDPLGDIGHTVQDLHKGDFRLSLGASFFYSNGGTRNLLGIGGDALVHWKGFHLLAEFLGNHSDPRTVPTQPSGQIASVQSLGAVGELGYMIFKDRLGVSARVEWLDPNTSVKDEADSLIAGGGLSYHLLHDLLKAQLDFTHRQELSGKALANDSLVLQLQLNL